MSHYAVLGLDAKATEADIKKAYRKKARDSHPDKNPNDPNAAKKFMKIKEAYDFLSNNAKRAEYDNKQAQEKRDAQRWAAYQVIAFLPLEIGVVSITARMVPFNLILLKLQNTGLYCIFLLAIKTNC